MIKRHEQERDDNDQDPHEGDDHIAHMDDAQTLRDQGGHGKRTRFCALEVEDQILQEDGNPQSAEKQVHSRGFPERPVSETLDKNAQAPGEPHGHDDHESNQDAGVHKGNVVSGQQGEHPPRDKAADHVNLAVGEVEHEQDAVDHGVADGDEGINPSEGAAAAIAANKCP